jgi:hypothetical protein
MHLQRAKRAAKTLRNIFADPIPRNEILVIRRVDLTAGGFSIVYEARGKSYVIKVNLPKTLNDILEIRGLEAFQPVLAAIAMAFSPFLFKLTDFRTVRMEAYPLDKESCNFFSRVLLGGLGEFRYLQGLNPARPIFVEASSSITSPSVAWATEDRILMLNGGGKDTIVAGELLKLAGQPFTWVTIRPNPARRAVIELSGNKASIEIGYEFDSGIEKDKTYPWGHFPHTSVVLSLGLLTAQLIGARFVCAGNEHSANYGNLNFKGFDINHQYTKSFEYEVGFYKYVDRCVTKDITVFSILRPFHDLQLAKIFANFENYRNVFISCNRGITRNEWCKSCPKCAFTAMALYPFVGVNGVKDIFGEDILNRVEIRKHILDLVGDAVKPWECVGTKEENRLALRLLLDRNVDLEFSEAPFRKDLVKFVKDISMGKEYTNILDSTNPQHLIPEEIRERLNRALDVLGEAVIVPAIIGEP